MAKVQLALTPMVSEQSEPSVLRGALSGFDKKGLLSSMGIGAAVAIGIHLAMDTFLPGLGTAASTTLGMLGAGTTAGVVAAAADAAVVHGASHVVQHGVAGAHQNLAESRRHRLVSKLMSYRGTTHPSAAVATAATMAPVVPSFSPLSFLPDPTSFQFDYEVPDNKTVKALVEQGMRRQMADSGVTLHGVGQAGEEASQPLGPTR